MHSGMYLQSLLEEVNICGACDLLQLVEQRLLVLAQGLKEGGGKLFRGSQLTPPASRSRPGQLLQMQNTAVLQRASEAVLE